MSDDRPEVPKIHIYDRLEELDERLEDGEDLAVRDQQGNEVYDIVKVAQGGVIIQNKPPRSDYRVITWKGEDNLQSDRYKVIERSE